MRTWRSLRIYSRFHKGFKNNTRGFAAGVGLPPTKEQTFHDRQNDVPRCETTICRKLRFRQAWRKCTSCPVRQFFRGCPRVLVLSPKMWYCQIVWKITKEHESSCETGSPFEWEGNFWWSWSSWNFRRIGCVWMYDLPDMQKIGCAGEELPKRKFSQYCRILTQWNVWVRIRRIISKSLAKDGFVSRPSKRRENWWWLRPL